MCDELMSDWKPVVFFLQERKELYGARAGHLLCRARAFRGCIPIEASWRASRLSPSGHSQLTFVETKRKCIL